jgi:hypothetical protein
MEVDLSKNNNIKRTGFPGSTNKLKSTLIKVKTREAINKLPVVSRTAAPTVCRPGPRLSPQLDKQAVYFDRNSMTTTSPVLTLQLLG